MTGHQRPVRGATSVWLTPPEIVAALGPFDLDPCAAINQPWQTAVVQYTEQDDGLVQVWEGFTWVNPPFGPEAEGWMHRLADHGDGIGLAAARTETRWFVKEVWGRADGILFLHGRPYFYRPDGTRGSANSGAPICLVAYGERAVRRLKGCSLAGTFVEGWKR